MRRTLRAFVAVFAISIMAAACGDLGPTAPVNVDADFDRGGYLGDGG